MKRPAAALNTRGASQPARQKEKTAGPRGEATSSGDAQPAAEVPAAAVMSGPRGAATSSDATKRVRVCSASSGAAQPAAELSAADERARPPRAATTSGATQRDRELSATQARLEQDVLAFGRWPYQIKNATTPRLSTPRRILRAHYTSGLCRRSPKCHRSNRCIRSVQRGRVHKRSSSY